MCPATSPPPQPASGLTGAAAVAPMPDCDVLTDLLTRYRTAVALDDGGGGRETRRRVEDVAYTLCVSTGTDDIDDALTAAGLRLAEARTEKHSCPIPEGTPRR